MARDLRVMGDDGIITLVEDELGAVHRLRLYNLPSQTQKPLNLDDVLPPGSILAIKEPYCEAASEDMSGIRVDHPSDLIYLSEGHALFPAIWKHQFDDPSVSPSESLKNEGNAFFKARKYKQSVLKYVSHISRELISFNEFPKIHGGVALRTFPLPWCDSPFESRSSIPSSRGLFPRRERCTEVSWRDSSKP